jgi:outer membrane protein assembly factor BamB
LDDYGAVKPYYGFAGSPLIQGDLVILTANTAGMALNKKTGKMVWASEPPPKQFKTADRRDINGADYATPVAYERQGKSYALFASWKGASAVEVQTGSPEWVYEWELYTGRHVSDPVVVGDRIFIAENSTLEYQAAPGCLLLDVSGERPAVLWKSPELVTEISTGVAIDGYLYGGQGGPYLYGAGLRCNDLKTGGLMWEKKLS